MRKIPHYTTIFPPVANPHHKASYTSIQSYGSCFVCQKAGRSSVNTIKDNKNPSEQYPEYYIEFFIANDDLKHAWGIHWECAQKLAENKNLQADLLARRR